MTFKKFKIQSVPSWLLVGFCFLLILTLRFYPALFQGKTLVFGDNYSLMVPGKIFTAHWLKQGVLPFWNPYIFAGLPWAADINQSLVYFSTVFFVWFDTAMAVNLNLIFHWLIAFIGACLLGERWTKNRQLGLIAGSLWLLSTQVSGSSNNFSTLQSLVWLPLVAYFGLRVFEGWQFKFALALTLTLQFLGGYPQHVLYAILAAIWLSLIDVLVVQKNPLKPSLIKLWLMGWAGAGILTLGLSAGAWLPFAEMLQNSTRMLQTSNQAIVGSLDPVMLLAKPWLAYAFDKPVAGIKWGPAWSGQPNVVFYLGWLGLFSLAIKLIWFRQKIDHWFFWPILGSLIFSFGGYLPGFSWFQNLVPFFKIARYPSMIMIATNLWLIIWLIETWKNWRLSPKLAKYLLWLTSLAVLVGILAWLATVLNFELIWKSLDGVLKGKLANSAFHTLERDKLISLMISENMIASGAFAILAILTFKARKFSWLWLILTLDLLYSTQAMFFFAPKNIYEFEAARPMVLPALNQAGWQSRFLTRNVNKPYADYGTYWEAMVVRAPFSDSFVTPTELITYDNLKHLRDGYTPDWNLAWQVPLLHGYTTLLPQDFDKIWNQGCDPRINFIAEVSPDDSQLKQWAVKYYLVDSSYEIKESLTDLPLVSQDRNWQIREIPGAMARFRYGNDAPIYITQVTENPNQIKLEFDNQAGQVKMILADRFDQDWQATVNGQPVQIENYQGMRQIDISPGQNQVVFTFNPRLFKLGWLITALVAGGFLALSLLVCLAKRR